MTLNPYFNNYNAANEQQLLENIIIESIQIYGVECIYLPRKNNDYDKLYGTSDIVTFEDHYNIECYLEAIDGFNSTTNFFSKFGLQINDQLTLVLATKRFNESIGTIANIPRPREGDLIYFPLNKKCFEIKFADNKKIFYPLGALQTFALTCELYEYSSEIFQTGIEEIDKIQKNYSLDILIRTIQTEDNQYITNEDGKYIQFDEHSIDVIRETLDDSIIVKKETSEFILFSEDNPYAEEREMIK